MVRTPVVETFATAEPEIMPISPEEITAAFAGPPTVLLLSFMPQSMRTWPPPVFVKNAPKIIK